MAKIDPNIRTFLEGLLDEAGMSEKELGKDVREQMLQDLYTRLEDRLILVALENLSEEKRAEFEKLAEGEKDSEKVKAFLQVNIPNIEGLYQKAMMDFHNVYLQGVQKA